MIPIYRFIPDTHPALEYVEEKIRLMELNDGSKIQYILQYYNLTCDPDKNNNVHKYLATEPYDQTTNIVGFLKYQDEPIRDDVRRRIFDPQDYRVWSEQFRRPNGSERLYKVPFITSYEQHDDQVLVGGTIVFNNINCPSEGTGEDDRIVYNPRFGEPDYIKGRQAECLHDGYPHHGCPDVPVVANLGSLMPNPNRKEINFIGSGKIRGIIVIAVAPRGGEYEYLANREAIPHEYIVSDFMNALARNPEGFASLLN